MAYLQFGGPTLKNPHAGGSTPVSPEYYKDWNTVQPQAYIPCTNLLAVNPKVISAVTFGATTTITATGHGLTGTPTVYLTGFTTPTQLNGWTGTATVVDANTFTIPVNSTGYTAFSNKAYVIEGSTPGWYLLSGGTATLGANGITVTPTNSSTTAVLAYYTAEDFSALTSITPEFIIDNVAYMDYINTILSSRTAGTDPVTGYSGTCHLLKYGKNAQSAAYSNSYSLKTGTNRIVMPKSRFYPASTASDLTKGRFIVFEVKPTGGVPNVTFTKIDKNEVALPTLELEVDDMDTEAYTSLLPQLTAIGAAAGKRVPCTLACETQSIDGSNKLTAAQIKDLVAKGWEIILQCSNPTIAYDLTTTSLAQALADVDAQSTDLVAKGITKNPAFTSQHITANYLTAGSNDANHATLVAALKQRGIRSLAGCNVSAGGVQGIQTHGSRNRYEEHINSLFSYSIYSQTPQYYSANIVSMTAGSPTTIVFDAEPWATNDVAIFEGLSGFPSNNRTQYTLTKTGTNTYTIPVNTTGSGPYTGGGTAKSPLRFMVDQWKADGGHLRFIIHARYAGGLQKLLEVITDCLAQTNVQMLTRSEWFNALTYKDPA